MTPSARATVLSNTASYGYTAIEMRAPSRFPSEQNTPFDGAGNLPFSKRLDGATYTGSLSYSNINNEAADFTQPVEAYWAFLDALFNDALARNLLVLWFPCYNGYNGGSEGWMAEMVANGATKMTAYGAYVGNRYKNQTNLVWMIAGDFGSSAQPYSGPQQTVMQAFIDGVKSVSGQQSTLFSAEAATPSISTDLPGTIGTTITLNGAYDFGGDVITQGRAAYSHGSIPAFLLEEPYDQLGPDGKGTNGAATQPVRRFQWWGWLSTIAGFVHGNGYVIHFDTGYASHLDTQATADAGRQASFMQSIPWYSLVPNGLGGIGTLITAGGGSGSTTVTAAATPDGAWLVAYLPPAHTGSVTIDMSKMRGTTRSRWFDPTAGTYTADATGLSNSGTHAFTTPGNNAAGDADWSLVLDA